MMPEVMIIVLNWNGLSDTLECLESLACLDYSPYEVVVVDNGSTDGSVEAVRGRFPDVTLIENGENLGFVGGNNVALRYALERDVGYVLLLNNDTVVDPRFLTELIRVSETEEEIGISSPLVLYYDVPDEIWTAGATINWANGATKRLWAGEKAGGSESVFDVDFVSGCALLAKREVIKTTGFLDPDYYLYYEEVDWCVRARAQGHRIVCVPRARIWHKVSRSVGPSSPLISYYMTRNALLLLRKRLTGTRRLLSVGSNLISTARSVMSIYVKRRNAHLRANARAQIRGVWDFVRDRFGAAQCPIRGW
jgi:GT2 family glycosyltransferase